MCGDNPSWDETPLRLRSAAARGWLTLHGILATDFLPTPAPGGRWGRRQGAGWVRKGWTLDRVASEGRFVGNHTHNHEARQGRSGSVPDNGFGCAIWRPAMLPGARAVLVAGAAGEGASTRDWDAGSHVAWGLPGQAGGRCPRGWCCACGRRGEGGSAGMRLGWRFSRCMGSPQALWLVMVDGGAPSGSLRMQWYGERGESKKDSTRKTQRAANNAKDTGTSR